MRRMTAEKMWDIQPERSKPTGNIPTSAPPVLLSNSLQKFFSEPRGTLPQHDLYSSGGIVG